MTALASTGFVGALLTFAVLIVLVGAALLAILLSRL